MIATTIRGAAVAAMLLAASNAMAGPEWVEIGDAGSLPSRAQLPVGTPGLTNITGTLGQQVDPLVGEGEIDAEDMYIVYIADPTQFIATTVPELGGSAEFDSQLCLLRLDGIGLLGNDNTFFGEPGIEGVFSDGATLLQSSTDPTETTITEPGLYLLAIYTSQTRPASDGGSIFEIKFFGEISGPDGPGGNQPITHWEEVPDVPDGTIIGGAYNIFLGGIQPIAEVHVDVKPGGCPNAFNRTSNGVLPITIAGTPTFDVASINLSTVRISRADGVQPTLAPHEGPPGPHSTYGDTATPYTGPDGGCHSLEGDGIVDLNLKFKSSDVTEVLNLHEFDAGALVPIKISGELQDGTPFAGFDWLRLVPPNSPPGLVNVTSNVAGAWINAGPPDLSLDTGGFANFNRTYPQSTVVTMSAPNVPNHTFMGWRINNSSTLIPGNTLAHVVTSSIVNIEAVYRNTIGLGETTTKH